MERKKWIYKSNLSNIITETLYDKLVNVDDVAAIFVDKTLSNDEYDKWLYKNGVLSEEERIVVRRILISDETVVYVLYNTKYGSHTSISVHLRESYFEFIERCKKSMNRGRSDEN